MIMARGKLDINVRLERQEKKILKLTAELEAAKDEYDNLLEEKKVYVESISCRHVANGI